MRLLVEVVVVDRDEESKTRVRITYRFGPPANAEPSSLAERSEDVQGNNIHIYRTLLNATTRSVPLVSVVVGLVIGEALNIDGAFKRFGDYLQTRYSKGESPVSRALVTTSLLFCVGPLKVLGSLEDGLTGDYGLLALKSALDLVASLSFDSVLGWGVLLSTGMVLVV